VRRGARRGPRAATLPPYGNCAVLPPDSDVVMFRCNDDRRTWYLSRGLAILVSSDPPVIRLTFKPNGPGHAADEYFTQVFENRCVVCGSTKNLSRHHIVPDAYRRHFPRESELRGVWMYDVLVLDIRCHEAYEETADLLRDDIAREFGIPPEGIGNITREQIQVIKAAAALDRAADRMPADRRDRFERILKGHLRKETLGREDYRVWKEIQRSIRPVTAGRLVAERILNLDDFAIRWRRHFVSMMRPRFLPKHWDVERRIYADPSR
jgi:hypothetical protein